MCQPARGRATDRRPKVILCVVSDFGLPRWVHKRDPRMTPRAVRGARAAASVGVACGPTGTAREVGRLKEGVYAASRRLNRQPPSPVSPMSVVGEPVERRGQLGVTENLPPFADDDRSNNIDQRISARGYGASFPCGLEVDHRRIVINAPALYLEAGAWNALQRSAGFGYARTPDLRCHRSCAPRALMAQPRFRRP